MKNRKEKKEGRKKNKKKKKTGRKNSTAKTFERVEK